MKNNFPDFVPEPETIIQIFFEDGFNFEGLTGARVKTDFGFIVFVTDEQLIQLRFLFSVNGENNQLKNGEWTGVFRGFSGHEIKQIKEMEILTVTNGVFTKHLPVPGSFVQIHDNGPKFIQVKVVSRVSFKGEEYIVVLEDNPRKYVYHEKNVFCQRGKKFKVI